MTMPAHLLGWALLAALGVEAAKPLEVPPMPTPAPLKDDAALVVQQVDGADAVTVLRDGGGVRLHLAGVTCDGLSVQAQSAATACLRQLLAGERVWMVPALTSQGLSGKWYLYRWPDRLLVNLEMVRQGYVDVAVEPSMPALTRKAFLYWRDQARRSQKGLWGPPPASLPSEPARPAAGGSGQVPRPIEPPRMAPAPAGPVRPPAASPSTEVRTPSQQTIVYVTSSGRKYHRADCRSLRRGGTPMPLEEARKNHEPCKTCRPPP